MTVKIARNSRLRFGSLVTADGGEFWDMEILPTIPVQSDDQSYVVKDGDRIDTLAYSVYGDASLWWVLAVGNNFEVVPTELIPGNTIRIPSPRYVSQQMFLKARIR